MTPDAIAFLCGPPRDLPFHNESNGKIVVHNPDNGDELDTQVLPPVLSIVLPLRLEI